MNETYEMYSYDKQLSKVHLPSQNDRPQSTSVNSKQGNSKWQAAWEKLKRSI